MSEHETARKTIIESWTRLQADLLKRKPTRLDPKQPSFTEYAWERFDPKLVLSILLSPEETYFAHREILFTGFCTWVVCPSRPRLIRHAMLLTAIGHMCRAEHLARAAYPESELLGDIIARLIVPDPDFYADFYYPIGGLRAIAQSASPGILKRSIQRRSFETPSVVSVMQVFHYHACHLRETGKHHRASLNKASDIIEKIDIQRQTFPRVVKDNVTKRWNRLKLRAALIYAASSIEVEPEKTLLDAVRDGEAHYEVHGPSLREWLGRAHFSARHILSHCYENKVAGENQSYLPPQPPREIPAPEFSSDERKLIDRAFKI